MADLKVDVPENVPDKSYDDDDANAIEMAQSEETQQKDEDNNENNNNADEEEEEANETTQLSAPASPTTPAPKPPSTYAITVKQGASESPGLLDSNRQKTPASTAPKPPNFVSRHSSAYLLSGMGMPILHDYTQMACCLIFFFWFIPLSIMAYLKAKAAVIAYNMDEYEQYKKLNRQARLYMVLSVGLTMMLILIAVLVVVLIEENEAPTEALPNRDDQLDAT